MPFFASHRQFSWNDVVCFGQNVWWTHLSRIFIDCTFAMSRNEFSTGETMWTVKFKLWNEIPTSCFVIQFWMLVLYRLFPWWLHNMVKLSAVCWKLSKGQSSKLLNFTYIVISRNNNLLNDLINIYISHGFMAFFNTSSAIYSRKSSTNSSYQNNIKSLYLIGFCKSSLNETIEII